jgi:hypothetical protein
MGSTLPPSPITTTANLKLAIRNSRIWLPSRALVVNQAMASPPTVTNNTTAQLTGATWSVGSGTSFFSTAGTNGLFTPSRGAIAAPSYGSTVKFANVTTASGPTYGTTSGGWAFYHTGQNLELIIAQNAGMYFRVKVDGLYVSLTPQTSAGDSSTHYYLHAFGSRARRRIDIIGYNFQFVGVNTDANDSIVPAELIGPRCIFLGDSFTAGSGASAATVTNYVNGFADAMGWHDVWASGVGGTGYLNPGTPNVTFIQRVQHDVIQYQPEIVWVVGGINDYNYNSSTPAQLQAAATALYQTILNGVPGVLLVVSPNINGGVGRMSANVIQMIGALKSAAQSVGALWIDPTQLPFGPGMGGQSGAIAVSKGSGTSAPIFNFVPAYHGTYLIDTGAAQEMIQIKTYSQTGSGQYTCTMDGTCQYAHNAGAPVVQTGGSYLTGTGYQGATTGYGNSDLNVYTDDTHPTDAGHLDLGQTLTALFMRAIATN